ncbi:hypothetical protein BC940DRAFT_315078 [Gongronella butleri]|nr:hypothetical protein BC940DRAFT_315078 [Gongronella butleri]
MQSISVHPGATDGTGSTGPAPTSQRVSKTILRSAIQKANTAVVLDKANDVSGAIDAYSEAVKLLNHVLSMETRPADQQRLQDTYSKYVRRIQYLKELKASSEDNDHQLDETNHARVSRTSNSSSKASSMLRKVNSSTSLDLPLQMPSSKHTSTQSNPTAPLRPRRSSQPHTDAPPSPISSKSTPSRPSSARKSTEPPPPLEPKSVFRPTRKSSRTAAMVHLEAHPTPIHTPPPPPPPMSTHRPRKDSSLSKRLSIESHETASSTDDSDSAFVAANEYPPSLALPSLIPPDAPVNANSAISTETINSYFNENDENHAQRASQAPTAAPMLTSHSQPSNPASNGRSRTSSLPRKLNLSRQGSGHRIQRLVSLDFQDDRPVLNRKSSALSMRRKQRTSRNSLDGSALGVTLSPPPIAEQHPLQWQNNQQMQQPQQALPSHPLATSLPLSPPAITEPMASKHLEAHLKLVLALEQSMIQGSYITPNLFIPQNLWQQSNVRLTSMDIKVAACETLMIDLTRIEKWRDLDDIRGSLRLIESLEEVVDNLQVTLSKKLKRDSLADQEDTASPTMMDDMTSSTMSLVSGGGPSSQASNGTSGPGKRHIMSWGSKLTKSVERMNAFTTLSNKAEDQHRMYIQTLAKLFTKLHILDTWFMHYVNKDRQKNPHYDALLAKLGKVCDGINRVVGAFVLRDVAILLGKWLKRGGSWVND